MLSKVFFPLRYFRLRNKEKRMLDIAPTLIMAVVLTLPYTLLTGPSFFKPNGFLDKMLTLTSCLTGFYVAALVAAATFAHRDLDKVIRSGHVALITKDDDGARIQEHLTRRQFACYNFGYLSFASLAISLIAGFFVSISGVDLQKLNVNLSYLGISFLTYYELYRSILIFMCLLIVSHLFVATCLGLYYLMDRLYTFDMEVTSTKIDFLSKSNLP